MNPANLLTCSRILLSLVMLFLPVFSPLFTVCYLACGLTDMIDGTVARALGTASETGAKLDTAADIVFAAAAFCRILPVMMLPKALWIGAGTVALIKISNIVSGFHRHGCFVTVHDPLNKATGFMLFVLPLMRRMIDPRYSGAAVCALAAMAALREGRLIRTQKSL